MTILRISSWLAALALAVAVGMSSYVIVYQMRAPAKSLAAGFPPSAIASVDVAVGVYVARETEDPQTRVSDVERQLARQAYRDEPLSSQAVGMLALAMTQSSEAETRQMLLENAGKLSRRNALVGRELIKSAALRGDDRNFFAWLSRAMLANDQLRQAYVAAMADATARQGAVAALTPVIGSSPRWTQTYWYQVTRRPNSLVNAAKLRMAVAAAPWDQTSITPTDRELALGLVGIGQFDLAQRLAQKLEPRAAANGLANLLVNADFARQPSVPPFDWELTTLGNLGSSINVGNRELLVSAIGGARGIAARQLLHLPAGRYVLGWSLVSGDPLDVSPLAVRIQCAERGVEAINPPPVPLLRGKRQANVSIGYGACRWYWFSVTVAMSDDSGGIDARLQDISLTRDASE